MTTSPLFKRLLCLSVLSLSALAYAEDAKTDDPLQSIKARAWILMSAETGEILASKEPQLALPMASTTKITTALLALRYAEQKNLMKETVIVSKYAAGIPGSRAGLQEDDELTLEELFYGLLLPSGNDASVAIAEFISARMGWALPESAHPGEAVFVEQMNAYARELELKNTRFINPHGGAPKGPHRSSVFDLAQTMRAALRNETLCKFMRTSKHTLRIYNLYDDEARTVELTNTNKLLGKEGIDLGKTGTTGEAGTCLVCSAVRALKIGDAPEKEYRLITVVLRSESGKDTGKRYEDTSRLYKYGWEKLQNAASAPAAETNKE